MRIRLLGTISVKFRDIEGKDQVVQIQLPDYILANYIRVEGKPVVSLISGNMVVVDKDNKLKSVIMIKGMLKKKNLFGTTYEPNIQKDKKDKLIEGIIYKMKDTIAPLQATELEKLKDLRDIEFELAQVSGSAIDKPEIQNISYSNWAGVHFADPIPTELAIPSDIRFREDLICLKKGEAGKGKIAKGKLTKQQKEDKEKRAKGDKKVEVGKEGN